jgi:Eukaryotic-type carbonic anhydrase
MEAYDDARDWPILNKVICAWREAEEKNRKACGLPSIQIPYPGCVQYNRNSGGSPDGGETNEAGNPNSWTTTTKNTTNTSAFTTYNNTIIIKPPINATNNTSIKMNATNDTAVTSRLGMRRREIAREVPVTDESQYTYKPAISAYDIIFENHFQMSSGNTSYQPKRIKIEDETYDSMDDFDWDAFIAQSYIDEQYHSQVEEERQQFHPDGSLADQNSRHLMDYQHIPWFNYFPMIGVKTEYFYRYSGTQTKPPCYGRFVSGSRKQTLHWRVMKDPIRVSHRQINEMHRLIKERIAPKDSPTKACKPDTGAAPDPEGDPNKVWVARPLQSFSTPHWAVFCDCASWGSKFEEDKRWCRMFQDDQQTRYFEHPYNFPTVGF